MPSHTYSPRSVRHSAGRDRPTEKRPRRTFEIKDHPTWEYRSRSAAETDRLGQVLGKALRGGEMIALYGDLGTGKTALVRGIAAGLHAPPRAVSSPTFVLIHHYHGRLSLVHADLYRLSSAVDLFHLGMEEHFDRWTVVAIEWAEKASRQLPPDRLEVHFEHLKRTSRSLSLYATGVQSAKLLKRVMRATAGHALRFLPKKATNTGPTVYAPHASPTRPKPRLKTERSS